MDEREKFMELIGLLSSGAGPEEMLTALLPLLQHWSGCEAVGIRLRTGHEHPNVETDGFSDDFIQFESRSDSQDGEETRLFEYGTLPDRPSLNRGDCCAYSATTTPTFTPHGSFWTNGTPDCLEATGEPVCASNPGIQGAYQSMALVPLRFRAETFGVLLFNDTKPGRFNPELISFLEKLADSVALALSRIQAEKAQKENEELYRAIFCANIAVKLLVDPETGAIIDANSAACEFYGYSHKEMTRLSIFNINTLPQQQMHQLLEQTWTNQCKHFQFKHRLANGEIRDVEVYSGPVQRQGRPLLFSIVHDVTDRVQAEEMRRRVEAILRHDLKSPLTGIIGLSTLVSEHTPEGRVKEWARAIRECGEGMYRLVELNLDIFKMEQGFFTLNPEQCDLARILRRIHVGMTSALRCRELDMFILSDRNPFRPETVLPFRCNPPLLENMLSNLLQNALEASPEKGTITVEIERSASALTVGIHNQGAVPEDIRSSFFQKYATSGKRNGTGLGTYSARLIAQAHGGDITFNTSESDGTRVLVRLPVQPE